MKQSIRRFSVFVSVLVLGFAAAPKKSEAATMILITPGINTVALVFGIGLAAGGAATGITTAVGGFYDDTLGLIGAGILLVLDADGGLPSRALENQLQAKYSFLEYPQFFRSLGASIKAKAERISADENGRKFVSVSRQEIESLLVSADTRGIESEIESMIRDLE